MYVPVARTVSRMAAAPRAVIQLRFWEDSSMLGCSHSESWLLNSNRLDLVVAHCREPLDWLHTKITKMPPGSRPELALLAFVEQTFPVAGSSFTRSAGLGRTRLPLQLGHFKQCV